MQKLKWMCVDVVWNEMQNPVMTAVPIGFLVVFLLRLRIFSSEINHRCSPFRIDIVFVMTIFMFDNK
jgi:hypothetical protein